MFRKGVQSFGVSVFPVPASEVVVLIIGFALLCGPPKLAAQHGGGGGGRGIAGGGLSSGGVGRPDGVSEKDELKDFHRAIAVQATAEQRAAFTKVAGYAQAARDELHVFRESLRKVPAPSSLSDRAATLREAIDQAHASNQNFLTSFSSAQRSGLKEFIGKVTKADDELDKAIKMLDQSVQTAAPASEQIENAAASLDKELTSLQKEQLALAGEMGILFQSGGSDLAFNLPKVTNSIIFGSQPISVPTSGVASRISTENGHDIFSVRLSADLSDVQQHFDGALRSEINRTPRCGERIEIRDATLSPLADAGVVAAHLHFERWICPPGLGGPMEAAAGDAAIDVELLPSVDKAGDLRFVAKITRVEAEGFLRNLLSSGELGTSLSEQVAAVLVAATEKSADLKAALPPVARESATLQRAQFQDAGADQLNLLLEGRLQFSEEQTKQFAIQLKQHLSAQGGSER
jgi:hypothetical protein